MSSLPPELWGLVVNLLRQHDQITCLSVSKMHHDLALPNVFSHVKVKFGLWIWRPWKPDRKPIRPSSNEREHMARGHNTTLDFLRAIPSRPDLAKVIIRFTVYACIWEDSEDADEQGACILSPRSQACAHQIRLFDRTSDWSTQSTPKPQSVSLAWPTPETVTRSIPGSRGGIIDNLDRNTSTVRRFQPSLC